MRELRNFSFASRIYRLSGTVILVYLLVIGWLFLEFRESLYEARRQEVRHRVESGWHVLDWHARQVATGQLTVEEGQSRALQVLRSQQFDNSYFWIGDLSPTMLMHPANPEFEGMDLAGYRDSQGRSLFADIADSVRGSGEGFFTYRWPQPGATEPVEKITFVKSFPAWGWMIGAGFYRSDIDDHLLQLLFGAGVVLVLVTAGALLLVTYVTHSITLPMGQAVAMIEALEQGDLDHRLHLDQADEVGRLARAMDAFADNLQSEVLTAFDHLAQGDFSFEAKGLIREPLARANALLNALVAELDSTVVKARDEKSKIEGLIAAMGDGVAILDPGMRVVYQNPIHVKQVGHRVGELCFHSSADGDRACGSCTVRQALAKGKVHRIERRLVIDGREMFIEATASPVHNEEGELVALIEIARDVTDRKRAEKRVEFLAFHDSLTGLANRALLEDRLKLALAAARRNDEPGALFFIDLDRFKMINDSLGHHAGDLLLQEAARRLQALVRATDTVCRSGGDEFILLLPQLGTAADAAHLAEKIIASFSRAFTLEEREVFVSPSIGISFFPADGDNFATLSRHADAAMYQAKEMGRNTFQFFKPELAVAVQERLALENDLRQALARDELKLHYQPQFDAATGRIVGVEALARWDHPQHGNIPPEQFIAVAEECGLIEQLKAWELRLVCSQLRQWREAGFAPIRMAVNISSRQFRQASFIATVDRILADTGFDPHWLEMEVTERVLMENVAATRQTLAALKARGISLAIDDFGTGYSSLSYLRQFSVDRLKIDRSFVAEVTSNADAAAIAGAIISLARSLHLEVVAEGVETAEQANFLRERRCHVMQGYYFARPAEAENLRLLFEMSDPQRTPGLPALTAS